MREISEKDRDYYFRDRRIDPGLLMQDSGASDE
jgi:hypothetical protein